VSATPRPVGALLLVLALMIAACGLGTGPPASPAATSPVATPAAASPTERTAPITEATPLATTSPDRSTAAASTSPETSPTPSSDVRALHYGTLEAGTYQPAIFNLALTFSVTGGATGWACTWEDAHSFGLAATRNALDDLTFALPSAYRVAGKGLIPSLASQGVNVPAIDVTVAGIRGSQLEFLVPGNQTGFGLLLFSVPDPDGLGTDSVFEPTGTYVRVIDLPRGDGDLLIVTDGPSKDEYQASKALADALLASLSFA
jgi:hypothetical protein